MNRMDTLHTQTKEKSSLKMKIITECINQIPAECCGAALLAVGRTSRAAVTCALGGMYMSLNRNPATHPDVTDVRSIRSCALPSGADVAVGGNGRVGGEDDGQQSVMV